MAKTGSYIKLDRGLKTNSLWLETPFSRGQAWVDLLLLAQGVGKEKQYRGQIQHQKPGVVYTSIIYLSKRWGWHRSKVYRFLETLISLGMVEIQGWTINRTNNSTKNSTKNSTNVEAKNSTTNGTIITIENWAFYQYSETNNSTNNDTYIATNDDTKNRTLNRTLNRTHNRKHTEKAYREIPPNPPKGGSSPDGEFQRGTDAFRNRSHELLKPEEGTVDDIPQLYREMFNSFADYWRYRNQ